VSAAHPKAPALGSTPPPTLSPPGAPASRSDGEGDADGASAAIDEALAEDRLRAEAKGVGMHAALRHARPGASGGPKAVLADKRAHDLDEDIRVRRHRWRSGSRRQQMHGATTLLPSPVAPRA